MSSPFFAATVAIRRRTSVRSVFSNGNSQDAVGEKQTLKQRVWQVVRSKRFGIACAALVLFLFGIGMVMTQADMDVVTAAYVVVQVVTTVGYGDITPRMNLSKLCVSAYALISLVIIAYVVNRLVAALMERAATAASRSGGLCCLRDEALADFLKASLVFGVFLAFGTVFYATWENCTCGYRGSTLRSQFVEGCVVRPYDTCVATGGKTKSFVDTFYMSVITLTSVGFGDIRPESQLGRVVAIFWMPLGVASTGKFMKSVTTILFAQSWQAMERARETSTNEGFMEDLDQDADGQLTRAEHHLDWLVEEGMLAEEVLAQMDASYNERFVEGFRGDEDQDANGQLTRAEHHLDWLVTEGLLAEGLLTQMDASYSERFVEGFTRNLDQNAEGQLKRAEHHLDWLVTKGLLSEQVLTEMDAMYKERFGSRKGMGGSKLPSDSTCTPCGSQVNAMESDESKPLPALIGGVDLGMGALSQDMLTVHV